MALVNAGADPNARDTDGWTPLHMAAEFADPQIADVLLDAGANASLKNVFGETAFDVAKNNQLYQGTRTLQRISNNLAK